MEAMKAGGKPSWRCAGTRRASCQWRMGACHVQAKPGLLLNAALNHGPPFASFR